MRRGTAVCLALGLTLGALAVAGAARLLPLPAFAAAAAAPDDTPVYYGRKLEPRGRVILHGAGQTDDPSFREYSFTVAPARPMLYMSYVDLKDNLPVFFKGLELDLRSYREFVVPQIGLSLNEGSAAGHYEQQVADGALDGRIDELCGGLRTLARPVFLRIGYEFNGQWNGYEPDAYVAAYRRIHQRLQACSPETATVWDYAPDGARQDIMRFYPGDDAVDWWGINLFSSASFRSSETRAFLAGARAHRFPVMIGESTPRDHPVTEGQASVDEWFKPYFDLLHGTPEIKAFCYISWDWRLYPQWATWGDARIEDNVAVREFYRRAVAGPEIQSVRDEAETRRLLELPARGK